MAGRGRGAVLPSWMTAAAPGAPPGQSGGAPSAGAPPGMPPPLGMPPAGMPSPALGSSPSIPPMGIPPPMGFPPNGAVAPSGMPPGSGLPAGITPTGQSGPPPMRPQFPPGMPPGLPPPGMLPPGLSAPPASQPPKPMPQFSSFPGAPPPQPHSGPLPGTVVTPAVDKPAPAKPVPEHGWTEHEAPDGRMYYYNVKTKQSAWEKPKELMTSDELADQATGWKEFTAKDGRKYYYHKESKQSKWTMPEELREARAKAKAATGPPAAISSAPTSALQAAPPGPGSVPPALAPSINPTPQIGMAPLAAAVPAPAAAVTSSVAPVPASLAVAVTSAPTISVEAMSLEPPAISVQAMPEPLVFATKQEAKDAFKQMLTDKNIRADTNWDNAMRQIMSDARYGALKSLGEKKACFNEWIQLRLKEEKEEKRQKAKQVKADFVQMLKDSVELKSTLRFNKAHTLFEDEPRWKAIESNREREELYEDYIVDLAKQEKENKRQERKERMAMFRQLLEETSSIRVDSQWRKVNEKLEKEPRCKGVDKVDRLEVFQEYIRDLERNEVEQKQLEKESRRRQERKNRDAFTAFLKEQQENGLINARTTWRQYLPLIKKEDAYEALYSNTTGSKPRDLFEDIIEELEEVLDQNKALVTKHLKAKKAAVSSSSTKEELLAELEDGDEDLKAISQTNIRLIYEDLMMRAKEKEEKEMRRQRRLAEDFKDALRAHRAVTHETSWETTKVLMEEDPAYISVGDESVCEAIFQEHITKLAAKAKEKEERRGRDKEKKERRDRGDGDKRELTEREGEGSGRKKDKKRHKDRKRHYSDSESEYESDRDKKRRKKSSRKHDYSDYSESDEDRSKRSSKRRKSNGHKESRHHEDEEEDGEIH